MTITTKMSIEDVKKFAMKNYSLGGDTIIECWDDEAIEEFISEDGTEKGLMSLIDMYGEYNNWEY